MQQCYRLNIALLLLFFSQLTRTTITLNLQEITPSCDELTQLLTQLNESKVTINHRATTVARSLKKNYNFLQSKPLQLISKTFFTNLQRRLNDMFTWCTETQQTLNDYSATITAKTATLQSMLIQLQATIPNPIKCTDSNLEAWSQQFNNKTALSIELENLCHQLATLIAQEQEFAANKQLLIEAKSARQELVLAQQNQQLLTKRLAINHKSSVLQELLAEAEQQIKICEKKCLQQQQKLQNNLMDEAEIEAQRQQLASQIALTREQIILLKNQLPLLPETPATQNTLQEEIQLKTQLCEQLNTTINQAAALNQWLASMQQKITVMLATINELETICFPK